ncbi:hypothetical protein O7605_28795 [Verrucosispora sp. WMMA2121]|uniref:hypothetical protein n=1 Tax=Verrucosispora sp. WMMA2121 TaxID=3015164 RepID=UPI0022B63F4F|nr:hypothetical protein [Verrucosispora sp. WMMA2121]MCZ7423509.1 hypothetical protein [Verrucosispora sp. WMMA2121]
MRVVDADPAAAWNGPEGTHRAEHHDRREDLDGALLDRLFRMAEIGPTDVVLDRCGTGRTCRTAARGRAPGRADHPGIAPAGERDHLLSAVEPYDPGAGVRLSGRHPVVTARRQ